MDTDMYLWMPRIAASILFGIPLVGVWFIGHTGLREDSALDAFGVKGRLTTRKRLLVSFSLASALAYVWLGWWPAGY